jgi:hypothetical protein
VLWYISHIVNSVVYAWGITTMTIICFTCHNTSKNMPYASQRYQQNVLCITTLTTICVSYHNSDNNMSYVSHIVVSDVIRMTYCCQCCDTYDILLSSLWYVRHIVIMSYVAQHWQPYLMPIIKLTTIFLAYPILTTACHTFYNTETNIAYVSQHWQYDTKHILLSVLWYIRHFVDSVLMCKAYFC